jgi:hypothetical protein
MIPVKTEFKTDIEAEQKAAGDSDRKPGDIDE